MRVAYRGRGSITQTPQHHTPVTGHSRLQSIDCAANVLIDAVKTAIVAFAVSHDAVIIVQYGIAFFLQGPGEQDKLSVTTNTVLSTPNHNYQDCVTSGINGG